MPWSSLRRLRRGAAAFLGLEERWSITPQRKHERQVWPCWAATATPVVGDGEAPPRARHGLVLSALDWVASVLELDASSGHLAGPRSIESPSQRHRSSPPSSAARTAFVPDRNARFRRIGFRAWSKRRSTIRGDASLSTRALVSAWPGGLSSSTGRRLERTPRLGWTRLGSATRRGDCPAYGRAVIDQLRARCGPSTPRTTPWETNSSSAHVR